MILKVDCMISFYWMNVQYARARAPRYDDVIKWKHFPRYWPCVRCHRGHYDVTVMLWILRSLMYVHFTSLHNLQWIGHLDGLTNLLGFPVIWLLLVSTECFPAIEYCFNCCDRVVVCVCVWGGGGGGGGGVWEKLLWKMSLSRNENDVPL